MILLKHGANVNARSQDGRTPLMWAAFRGDVEMMNILLANEADTSLTDCEGLNCFDLAVINLHYEAAHYLYTKQGMNRTPEER